MSCYAIKIKSLTVNIQENGVIRSESGLLIGRLVSGIDFNSMAYTEENRNLKPYQVGENDIVAAYTEEQAMSLLLEKCAWNKEECADFDIEDLSGKLDMKMMTEDGVVIETLGDWMERLLEPQYLFGWE